MNFENVTKSRLTKACSKVRQATWVYPMIGLTLASLATSSQAAIIVSPGESIIFQDSFDDNSNSWSNVARVNGTGTATTDEWEIGSSTLQPSLNDGNDLSTLSTLGSGVDITDGAISVYTSVQFQSTTSSDGGNYSFSFGEGPSNRFVGISIRPGEVSRIQYRDAVAVGTSSNITNSNTFVTSTTEYYSIKLTFSAPTGVANPGTAEAFYYNTVSASYVSMGSATGIDYEDGIFTELNIYNRNGSPDGDVILDEIMVTQVPEPSTLALLGIFAFATLLLNRKKKRD